MVSSFLSCVLVSICCGRELACTAEVSLTRADPLQAVLIPFVLQYLCRWPMAVARRFGAFVDSWNTLSCSSAEHSCGAVAQGIPSARLRCRSAAFRIVSMLVLASFAQPVFAVTADCDNAAAVTLLPVGADVWRVPAARGESDAANGGQVVQLVVVRDGARVWVIGSGPTPAAGIALGCAIRHQLGRPVTDVINTRAAPELSMGNGAFAAARQWALPDVIAAMRARCPACLDRLKARIGPHGNSLRLDAIRVPSRPIGSPGATRGRLGPFDWRAFARAPHERTLVLRLRRERIVIAQGLVWAGDVPNLRDTRSATLLASLRALQRFARGTRVLGEQGDIAGPGAIASHIDYIEQLRNAALPHLIRGDVDGAAGGGVELPTFGALPGYAASHPLNVQRVWRELEPELFR